MQNSGNHKETMLRMMPFHNPLARATAPGAIVAPSAVAGHDVWEHRLATVGGGSEERAFGSARWGTKIGESSYARIWGKWFDHEGGHDEEHDIDAGSAREHVADEAFMAGHVDEREDQAIALWHVREPDVDRDAAFLLLLETIRIGAGERADERRLAMVHVAGRADDDVARHYFTLRRRSSSA